VSLRARELTAAHGGVEVLHGVSLELEAGTIGCVLGANGAGKTTLARCLAGLHLPHAGSVLLDEACLDGLAAHRRVRAGLSLVPENRCLFGSLTVAEHLAIGARAASPTEAARRQAQVHELFPVLSERARQRVDTLSGGQQQMVAVARALMGDPRYLVLDEPGLGLAPSILAGVLERLRSLAREGTGILLIEQNARAALRVSTSAWVLQRGHLTLAVEGSNLENDPRFEDAYLGEPTQ